MTDKEFINRAYKVAFGKDTKIKDYSREQVIGRLLSVKDALAYVIEREKLD